MKGRLTIKRVFFVACTFTFLISCKDEKNAFDASGNFEATETIVSAESNGKILSLEINEGDKLQEGQFVGSIDSTQFYLTRLQLLQNRKTVLSGRPDISVQLASLKKEWENIMLDKQRIQNMVNAGEASTKQLDDINAKLEVLQSRIRAQQSSLETTTASLDEQGNNVKAQMALVDDQLRKCRILNPVRGTVLAKYAEPGEMTSAGKPLYKIANLDTLDLKAYVTGDLLSGIQLDQVVTVRTDNGRNAYRSYPGRIRWIADKSEFTPKTIQTKAERANLVYAIKVSVKNDGYLKIGMYGEVLFGKGK